MSDHSTKRTAPAADGPRNRPAPRPSQEPPGYPAGTSPRQADVAGRPRLNHICCGQRLGRHAMARGGADLAFTYCDRCEAVRWLRADRPASEPPALVDGGGGSPQRRAAGLPAAADPA